MDSLNTKEQAVRKARATYRNRSAAANEALMKYLSLEGDLNELIRRLGELRVLSTEKQEASPPRVVSLAEARMRRGSSR